MRTGKWLVSDTPDLDQTSAEPSRRKGEGMASCLRFAFVFLILGAGVQSARAEGDAVAPAGDAKPRPINFARDVRPILADNCFACHGPDDKARKAGLRLDTKEGAFAKLKSGGLTIAAGKPDESDLVFRIESDDPELHMPPKKSGKQLTADQVAMLRRWIEQGGTWSTHWAFDTPKKPALPVPQEHRLGRQ